MSKITEDFKVAIKKKLKESGASKPISTTRGDFDNASFDDMTDEEINKLHDEVDRDTARYDYKTICMNCNKEKLICTGTGCCEACDNKGSPDMFGAKEKKKKPASKKVPVTLNDGNITIVDAEEEFEEIKPKKTPPVKNPKRESEKKSKSDDFELDVAPTTPIEMVEIYPLVKEPLDANIRILPPEAEVRAMINRYKFVKAELVDKNDFVSIKGKPYLKKSGYRKFVNAFGISVELVEMNAYELYEDRHAEVRLKVSVPSGQTVEGIGICSWSELQTKTLHNMKATAWTRAFNRGIADLVAYGEVSAEEVMDISKLEIEDF